MRRVGRLAPALVPLREIREVAGKTQSEMAELLGTNQGEISRLERRVNVEVNTIRAYARALGFACELVFESRSGKRVVADLVAGGRSRPRVNSR